MSDPEIQTKYEIYTKITPQRRNGTSNNEQYLAITNWHLITNSAY